MKTSHPATSLLSRTAMALALGLTGIAMMPEPAIAAAPMIKVQVPGFYRIMLGDFQITALNDGTDDQPVDKLLSEPATRTNAMLKQSFLKSALETSVNAFLINTDSRRFRRPRGRRTSVLPRPRTYHQARTGPGLDTRELHDRVALIL